MKLTKEDIDTIAKFTAFLVTKIFIRDEPTIEKGSTDPKIEKPAVFKPVKEKKKPK